MTDDLYRIFCVFGSNLCFCSHDCLSFMTHKKCCRDQIGYCSVHSDFRPVTFVFRNGCTDEFVYQAHVFDSPLCPLVAKLFDGLSLEFAFRIHYGRGIRLSFASGSLLKTYRLEFVTNCLKREVRREKHEN